MHTKRGFRFLTFVLLLSKSTATYCICILLNETKHEPWPSKTLFFSNINTKNHKEDGQLFLSQAVSILYSKHKSENSKFVLATEDSWCRWLLKPLTVWIAQNKHCIGPQPENRRRVNGRDKSNLKQKCNLFFTINTLMLTWITPRLNFSGREFISVLIKDIGGEKVQLAFSLPTQRLNTTLFD